MDRIEWLLAAFLVLGGSRFTLANPPANPATNLVRRNLPPLGHGILCIAAGRYEQTIAICDEVLRTKPDDRNAYALRGYAHLLKKVEPRQAIDDFTQALRLDAANAAVHVARAQAYRQVKDYDRAIADCTEAVHLDPAYGEAYAWRAGCYLAKRVTDKAVADYSTALRHTPRLAWARCGRAEAYRRRGETARALADLEHVLRDDPNNELAHFNRCIVYFNNLRDCDQVLAETSECIRRSPRDPRWYALRSLAYLGKGEKAKGFQDGMTALSLKPNFLHFRCSHSSHSLQFGLAFGPNGDTSPPWENDSDKRIAACTKRLAGDPNNVAAYYERAWSYVGKGDFQRALADFDEIVRRDPSDAEAHAEQGRAHRCLKQDAEAMKDYTAAIRLDPKNPNYYVSRASIYSKQKKYEKAWHDYNAALRLDRRIAVAHSFRGWMYDTHGDYDRAIAEYSEAARLSPRDADLYLRRAWIYADKGTFAEAITDFKKVLELDPQNMQAHRWLAWYLATCPDAELRDGKEARKHATTACEATKWQESRYLNTLAAACAECGDYTQAVKVLVKALELAPEEDKAYYQRRLKLYQSHKPYHLSPPAALSSPSSK